MSRPVIRQVGFPAAGHQLAGDLYLPENPSGTAVVVAGSWTSVKEQMAGRYAAGLAERGFAALAFDFSGYGASGGEPREFESPHRKAADLRAAVDWLSGEFDTVDALGICAGAGHVVAARDERVRLVALVAPWLHDAEIVREVYGDDKLAEGDLARLKYEHTGVVDYVPAVSETDERAAMVGAFDYYLHPKPQWRNRFAVMGWAEWLRFNPLAVDHRVPTLVVHSEKAAIPDGVRKFHAQAARSELVWLDGPTQFDFYDRDDVVNAALDLVARHFEGP